MQRFAVIILVFSLFAAGEAMAYIDCYDCHGTRNPVANIPCHKGQTVSRDCTFTMETCQ